MKPSRYKKVLGLALGEKSLMVAEVQSGDQAGVSQIAVMNYPEGVTVQQPELLGKALADFLCEKEFSARTAIVGLPLKWLVVKPKEVPVADEATLNSLLRLQAEAEFSTELKDLVYDYASGPDNSVLLMATPQRYIDSVRTICNLAKLNLAAVTPSALTLGQSTGVAVGKKVLVLSVTANASELSSQDGGLPSAIRNLRPPMPQSPFVSDLRRAISALSPAAVGERELVLWDSAGIDTQGLSQQLGMPVRQGELPVLGVNPPAGANGEGRRFAPAVALALALLDEKPLSVDFLHSRLPPPRESRIPPWAAVASLVVLVVVALVLWAYIHMATRQAEFDRVKAVNDANAISAKKAADFVDKVSFAQGWHAVDPRYLACLRELTYAIPDDGTMYATNLTVKEYEKPQVNGGKTVAPTPVDARTLIGALQGRASDQDHIQGLIDKLRGNHAMFPDVVPGPTESIPRENEFSFSIGFTFITPVPPAPKAAPATPVTAASEASAH